jgi:hypothetical protein
MSSIDELLLPSREEQQQQRLQEMAASELQFNIQMLEAIRKSQQETPCQTFYKMKKSIPLSTFLEVYPFNELVDCSLELNLEDLMELKRLYSTLEQSDQQFYVDSFRRLQQLITNKIPGSYGKGFQPWKEQVAANQEVQDVLGMPEPSQEEIDNIAYRNYMQTRIPSPAAPPPVPSLFSRVKTLLSLGRGKGRKTSKKILRRQKRPKSRSKKSHSKKSRSKSRSKK